MCKSSDVFSLAVLIDRGLDLCTKGGIVLGFLGAVVVDAPPLPRGVRLDVDYVVDRSGV